MVGSGAAAVDAVRAVFGEADGLGKGEVRRLERSVEPVGHGGHGEREGTSVHGLCGRRCIVEYVMLMCCSEDDVWMKKGLDEESPV